jgi:hypothetical protein
MKTFTNTIITKEELVSELKKHQLADNIRRGLYFKDGKGCAVGCSLESVSRLKGLDLEYFEDHSQYEEYFGLPEFFAHLTDKLFEGMSLEKSKSFPIDVIEAVKVGSNVSQIETKFKIIVLNRNLITLAKLDNDHGVIEITKNVISALKSEDKDELAAAESAAWSAKSALSASSSAYLAALSAALSAAKSAAYSAGLARSAAESAYSADSAVRSAARSAALSAAESADSAAESVESAVRSAASSASWSVAWSARSEVYDELADELIKLLKDQ